jgi:hypothetical protein
MIRSDLSGIIQDLRDPVLVAELQGIVLPPNADAAKLFQRPSPELVGIEDVETDSEFAPHRHIAGFRAVQSPPLVSRIHDPLGVPSTTLTKTLPRVCNRAQLHRVLLNLLINSTEAMTTVTNRPKLLQVQSMVDESGNVLVPVRDSGIGRGSETVAFSPPSLQQK